MKNNDVEKFIIITDIKNLRKIMNFLLDNFDRKKIRLEFFAKNSIE